jgi:hypothetical protein
LKSPHRIVATAFRRSDRHPQSVQARPALAPLAPYLAAALLAAAASASAPAYATLGQAAASVETDRMQVRASVRQVSHAAFTVHELTTEMNGLVREYVAPNGQVFAVTWHGPTMPNLQQVLGSHFDTLATAPHRQPGARAHVALNTGRLVFESTGHVRSFHGRAYLTDAIPAGVNTNDIQ